MASPVLVPPFEPARNDTCRLCGEITGLASAAQSADYRCEARSGAEEERRDQRVEGREEGQGEAGEEDEAEWSECGWK